MQALLSHPIILQNHRARLEPLQPGHYEALMNIAMDKSLWAFTTARINSEEDFKKYFETALEEREKGFSYPFAVIDVASGNIAGSTRYGNISIPNLRVEIGWTWYAATMQRTGLNRACKFELLRFAFEKLGCIRVELKTSSTNAKSQTAIAKIGATKEGVLRSHMINSDGTLRDTVYYSILEKEWPAIKSAVFSEYLQASGSSHHK